MTRENIPSFILEYPKEIGFDEVRDNIFHNPENPAEIWGKFEAGAFQPTGFDVLGQRHDPETGIHIRWFQKLLEGGDLRGLLEEIRKLNKLVHQNRRIIFGSVFEKIINHQAEGRSCRHIIAIQNRLSIGNTISEPTLGRLYQVTDDLIGEEIKRAS